MNANDDLISNEEQAVLEQLELMSNNSSSTPYVPHVLSAIGEETEPSSNSNSNSINNKSRSRSDSRSDNDNNNGNDFESINSRSFNSKSSKSSQDVFRSANDLKSIDDIETLSSSSKPNSIAQSQQSQSQSQSTKPPSNLRHIPTISSMSSHTSSVNPSSLPSIPSHISTSTKPPTLETPAFSSPFPSIDLPSSHSRSNSDSQSRAGNLIAFFENRSPESQSHPTLSSQPLQQTQQIRQSQEPQPSSPSITKVIQTKRPINLNRFKDDENQFKNRNHLGQKGQQSQSAQHHIPPLPNLPSPGKLSSFTDGWETMISSTGNTDISTPLTSHKTPLTSQRPSSPIDLSSFDDITEQIARAGTLWYLHVHDGTPYRWVRARAALLPTTLKLSFLPSPDIPQSRLQRQIVTLDLSHCSEVRSIASPSNPSSHRMDLGLVAAREQGNLEGVLNPFVLVYEDGWERLATDSARERVQWVGAFWDVIRPIHTPSNRVIQRAPSVSSTSSSSNFTNSPLLQPGMTTITGTPIVRRPVSPSNSNAGSSSAFNVRSEDLEPTASDSENNTTNSSIRKNVSRKSSKKRESLDDLSIGMLPTNSTTSDTIRGLGILSGENNSNNRDVSTESETDDIIFPPSVSVRAHRKGGRRRTSLRSSGSSSSSTTDFSNSNNSNNSKKSESKSYGTSTERMLKSPKLGQLDELDEIKSTSEQKVVESKDIGVGRSVTNSEEKSQSTKSEIDRNQQETPSPQQPEVEVRTPTSNKKSRSRTNSVNSIQKTPKFSSSSKLDDEHNNGNSSNDIIRSIPPTSSSSNGDHGNSNDDNTNNNQEFGTSTGELIRSLSRKSSKPSTIARAQSLSSSRKTLEDLAGALGDSPEDIELKEALSDLISGNSTPKTPSQSQPMSQHQSPAKSQSNASGTSLSRKGIIKKPSSTSSSKRSSQLREKNNTVTTEYQTAQSHLGDTNTSKTNNDESQQTQGPSSQTQSKTLVSTKTNSSPTGDIPTNNTEKPSSTPSSITTSTKVPSNKPLSRSRSQTSSQRSTRTENLPLPPENMNKGFENYEDEGEDEDFDMELLAPSRTGSPDSMWPPSRVSSLVSKRGNQTAVSRSSTIDSKLLAPTIISSTTSDNNSMNEKSIARSSSNSSSTVIDKIDKSFITLEIEKLFKNLIDRDQNKFNDNYNILNAIQSELELLSNNIRFLPFNQNSRSISESTEGELTEIKSIPDLPAEPQPESFNESKSNGGGEILRSVRNKSSNISLPKSIIEQPIKDDKVINELDNKVNSLIDICKNALDNHKNEKQFRDDIDNRHSSNFVRLENLVRNLIRHFTHGGASSISSWPDAQSEHPFDDIEDDEMIDDNASSSTITQKNQVEETPKSREDPLYPHDSVSMRELMGPLPTPPIYGSNEYSEPDIPNLTRRERPLPTRRRWARSLSPPPKSMSSISEELSDVDDYDDILYPDIYEQEYVDPQPEFQQPEEHRQFTEQDQSQEQPQNIIKPVPKINMNEGGYPRSEKDWNAHDFQPPEERLKNNETKVRPGFGMPMPMRPPMQPQFPRQGMAMPRPMNNVPFRGGFRPPMNFQGPVRPSIPAMRGFHPPMLPPMMGGTGTIPQPPAFNPQMSMRGRPPQPLGRGTSMLGRNANPMFNGSMRVPQASRFPMNMGMGPQPMHPNMGMGMGPMGVPPPGMGLPIRFGSDFHPGFNETLYNTRRAGWNTEEILKHQMDADRYLGALNDWLEKEVSAKINEWGPIQRQIKEMEEVLRDVRDAVGTGGYNRGLAPNERDIPVQDAPKTGGESRDMNDPAEEDNDKGGVGSEVGSVGPIGATMQNSKHPKDTMRGEGIDEDRGVPSDSEGGPKFRAERSDRPFVEDIPGIGKLLKGKGSSKAPSNQGDVENLGDGSAKAASQTGSHHHEIGDEDEGEEVKPGAPEGSAKDAHSYVPSHAGSVHGDEDPSHIPSKTSSKALSPEEKPAQTLGDAAQPGSKAPSKAPSQGGDPVQTLGDEAQPGSKAPSKVPSKALSPEEKPAQTLGDAAQPGSKAPSKVPSKALSPEEKPAQTLGDAAQPGSKAPSKAPSQGGDPVQTLGDAPEGSEGHAQGSNRGIEEPAEDSKDEPKSSHHESKPAENAGEEIERLPTPGAEEPQNVPLSLQPGVSPVFGSPAKEDKEKKQNNKKGKKGKKSEETPIDILGDEPQPTAENVEKVEEAARDIPEPGEAPKETGESSKEIPKTSEGGNGKAKDDLNEGGKKNGQDKKDKPQAPVTSTANVPNDGKVDNSLPDATQKVDQVLSDATNGQHRRDPGIEAILEILNKAFPSNQQQPLPPQAEKEQPKENEGVKLNDAERAVLEEKANNATKEKDEAQNKLNEMLAIEKAVSDEKAKNAEKEKAELEQKVKNTEKERAELEKKLSDINKMRDEHHNLIAESLKQLTSFTTAETDRIKAQSSKPSLQDIQNVIEKQNEENTKLLKVVASDVILHNTSQHRSTVGAIEKSNSNAMKGNIDAAVEEFKKQLLPEVRGLVKEIGDLREQKRGLQHEISELFAIKSKQGNGPSPAPKVDYNPRAPPAKENKKDDKPSEPQLPPAPAWLSWQPPNIALGGPPPLPSNGKTVGPR